MVAVVTGLGSLLSGCSPRAKPAEANPMQHGPDYFTAKWGQPIGLQYTDEWGNAAPKESAKGTAVKWKVTDTLTVEVLAVGDTVHCIQYSGPPGGSTWWNRDQLTKALEANGHGWSEIGANAATVLMGDMAPHSFVSKEGNRADFMPPTRQLTIKTPPRLQAELAKRAADEAAKAEAEKKIRF